MSEKFAGVKLTPRPPGSPVRARALKEEQPLKEGSPLFTEIRRLGADGARVEGLHPAGGWFEFRIPRAFFTKDGGELELELKLEWIDFYR